MSSGRGGALRPPAILDEGGALRPGQALGIRLLVASLEGHRLYGGRTRAAGRGRGRSRRVGGESGAPAKNGNGTESGGDLHSGLQFERWREHSRQTTR